MVNILYSVSKKDAKWREIAYKITGNKQDSDDLVQNMYLRLHKYNVEKWNYSFIILLLWNEFKDFKKKNRYTDEVEKDNDIVTISNEFSFKDEDLMYLKEISKLSDDERKLLTMNYDFSTGQIADNLDACRIKVYRDLIKIRKKVLKKDYSKKYKNRRLKYDNKNRDEVREAKD